MVSGAVWYTQHLGESLLAYVTVLNSIILDTVGPACFSVIWAHMQSEDRWIVKQSIRSENSVLEGQTCPRLIGLRRVRWLIAHGHSEFSEPLRDLHSQRSNIEALESWGDHRSPATSEGSWSGVEPFEQEVVSGLDLCTGWRHPGQ